MDQSTYLAAVRIKQTIAKLSDLHSDVTDSLNPDFLDELPDRCSRAIHDAIKAELKVEIKRLEDEFKSL